MNTSKVLIATLGFVALAGCTHANKRAENPPPPTPQQQAVIQLNTDRDAYIAQTQTRIDEMHKFSENLRAQADAAQKPRQKKLQNAADDMESALKDVDKELADVKTSAPENWIDEKRDVEKTMMRAETQYSNSVRLIQ